MRRYALGVALAAAVLLGDGNPASQSAFGWARRLPRSPDRHGSIARP